MHPLPHQLPGSADATKHRIGYTAPTQFVPLALETRPAVDTAAAAHYLSRRPQTLREWASKGTFPPGLRPFRVNGRLAWPVEGIRRVLGVA